MPGGGRAAAAGYSTIDVPNDPHWPGEEARVGASEGSPVLLTDETGALIATQDFDPFGASSSPTSETVSGFTGHRPDAGLGLVNAGFRSYDPVLGKFIQPDPIIADPFSSQGRNPYSYVENNPLSFVDPLGLQTEELDQCPGGRCGDTNTSVHQTQDPFGDPRGASALSDISQGAENNAAVNPSTGLPAPPMPGLFPSDFALTVENDFAGERGRQRSSGFAEGPKRSRTGKCVSEQPCGEFIPVFGPAGRLVRLLFTPVGETLPARSRAGLKKPRLKTGLGPAALRLLRDTRGALGRRPVAPIPVAERVLRPGGKLIGVAGSSSRIRILPGGLKAAQKLLSRLLRGGATRITPAGSRVESFALTEGGKVSLRTVGTGKRFKATIDVAIRGIGIRKIKFLP